MKLQAPAGRVGLVSCSGSTRVYQIDEFGQIDVTVVDLQALLNAGFTHAKHPIIPAIAGLADRTEAFRFVRKIEQESSKMTISMDRLKAKLAVAAQVAPQAAIDIEKDADALIARRDELTARRIQAFSPHHEVLNLQARSLNQLADALQVMGNGDPLDGSGDGSEKPPVTDGKTETEKTE